MEKVGILTLNGYFNYGNRLQNYALQEFIKMNGYECETIINKTWINKHHLQGLNKKQNKIKTLLHKKPSELIDMLKYKINIQKINDVYIERSRIFKEFSLKYINETNLSIKSGYIISDIGKRYKYLVAGSDQVWNPFDPMVSEVNFLTFVPNYKRISYAPSFGVYDIPNEEKENYKKWLLGMNYISVREDAGAKIVKDLVGREVPVLVDPTMILTRENWLSIAQKSKSKPDKKYLLTYILGGNNRIYRRDIKKIAKKYNLEIINLGDIKYIEHYITGPSEFIDYINDASVLFTDSFHGCVFSMLLDTPFIVCNRVGYDTKTSMESRIDTFLDKFKLQERRYSNIDNIDIFKYDYKEANKLLEIERKKAWNYLSNAFNNKLVNEEF